MIDYYGTTRERSRPTPSRPTQSHEFLIRAKYPGPAGQVVPRYKSSDIEICPSEAIATQFIADQVSAEFAQLVAQKRALSGQIRKLVAERKDRLNALRKKIVDSHAFFKTTYEWRTVPVWRPTRYKRVFIGNASRKIKVGERTVYRFRYDGRLRRMVLKPVQRSLFRSIQYPLYKRVVERPAGLVDSRRRFRKGVKTLHYWDRISSDWLRLATPIKGEYTTKIAALTAEKRLLVSRIASAVQRNNPLVAYRDGGRIAVLPTSHAFDLLDPGDHRRSASDVGYYAYSTLRAGYAASDSKMNHVITACPYCYGPWYDETAFVAAFDTADEMQRYIEDQKRPKDVTLGEPVARTAPRRAVDRVVFLDSSSDSEDEAREAYAASTVAHLDGAENYAFNLIRSIGEMKDVPQTVRQGRDFCRFLSEIAGGKVSRNAGLVASSFRKWEQTLGRVTAGIAAGYLAWKFAIQPTYQDIQTVLTHSSSWVTSLNRFLNGVLQQLSRTRSSVYHMRSKFHGLELEGDSLLRKTRILQTNNDVRSAEIAVTETCTFGHQHPALFVGGDHLSAVTTDPVPGTDEQLVFRHSAVDVSGHMSSWGAGLPFFAAPPVRKQGFQTEPAYRDVPVEPSPPIVTGSVWPSGRDTTMRLTDEASYLTEERKALRDAVDDIPITDPLYCLNHVSGVAFAKFATGDLLEYGEQLSGSYALANLISSIRNLIDTSAKLVSWQGLFQGSLRAAIRSSAESLGKAVRGVDYVYVLWQLYPLSFVVDWVTTSDRTVKMLNRMAKSLLLPPPAPIEPLGVCKRVELLAGMRLPTLVGQSCTRRVLRMAACRLHVAYDPELADFWRRPRYEEMFLATPSAFERTFKYRFSLPRTVGLDRTGVYSAARGRYESAGWSTILPTIRLKLDTDKLKTLLAMCRSALG